MQSEAAISAYLNVSEEVVKEKRKYSKKHETLLFQNIPRLYENTVL